MDECRKYLFEHRDELDLEKPPRPQVWKYIQRETQVAPKRVMPIVIKWSAAAAAIVLISLLTYQWLQPAKPADPAIPLARHEETPVTNPEQNGRASSAGTVSKPETETPATEQPGDEITGKKQAEKTSRKALKKEQPEKTPASASPLKLIEDNYASIINYQLEKLEKTPIYIESAGYFHVFKKQWFDLERDEKKVKQDVRLYGLSDNVVNNLIQLYQQKLWLLKELQTEINKMNARAKQHPDIQRLTPAYLKL